MNEFLTSLLDAIALAWWVEIKTENPRCTYFFGPFLDKASAASSQGGYVEDLEHEGAQNIAVRVMRCKPKNLTVYDDKSDRVKLGVLSNQF
ncbi:DUF1816 domain-containing protein [Myxacorys almedinensis]|uniref:DUF1816 domain-containing protein n=1 Tax=Myxacorys almedinensis A TaxID=2690445 RepID=A0A8J7Z022_9CYAN|nr:DUF1816 domain-containing protein [Myxacorys almedinensis]NDJ16555.1 DUF1816 domain-containing protein [Myxacorys almedinensis A]